MVHRAHNRIRIPFEIKGRNYEAVGFMNKGESPVNGDEMLRRIASENGGLIGKDDSAFIAKYRRQLPKKLQQYLLVTNYEDYYQPCVSCLSWSGHWIKCLRWFNDRYWDDNSLVVRRCA